MDCISKMPTKIPDESLDNLILMAGDLHTGENNAEPLRLNENTDIKWNDKEVLRVQNSGYGGINIAYSYRESIVCLNAAGLQRYYELKKEIIP